VHIEPAVVPTSLQSHVDALVQAAIAGVNDPTGPSFDLVTSWCEVHSDDSGFYSGDHGESFPVVWLENELGRCSDDDIESEKNPDDDAPISDVLRVTFVRKRLAGVFDGSLWDSDMHSMACEIRVAASDTAVASLCFYLSGYSFGDGPQIEWCGVYRAFDDFRNELRASGALTSLEEAERISDSVLLEHWRHHMR
jgi:hypothetical protein